ncbi:MULTISPECIES: CoA-transferase subunit beta [unclassified Sphingobium]|uniref:CoA-transferase subunit beta n=1 Tax=unclassified Sphingobium TaxID=2611147 RepID=UPI002224BEDD|nr:MULTISPECIES: CoA-transferase [unclassified Sphingobium]MCW2411567.1 glutaconate CoA-transferase subunit B [Sphingobium sp. B8D3D]MCW2416140.1 glutaconate CoA-transferase subunit B [Sphingobium sp. B8D3A]
MSATWDPFSYIVINLARFIRAGEVTFSGVNSTIPMLSCLLAKQAYDFDFTYINVAGGVDPRPSHIPWSSSDPVLAEGSSSIFANEDFYDLCTRGEMDLCFLGAAQINKSGNTNNSVIGEWSNPKVRLPGGGGAAVMLPTARRAYTWRTEHTPRTLVEKLDFQTASGGMSGIVTPIAVLELRNGSLEMTSHHPDVTAQEVVERTGFALSTDNVGPTAPPTEREQAALAALDFDGRHARNANVHLS